MSKHFAFLAATASVAVISAPALAQVDVIDDVVVDDRYADIQQAGTYDGEWEGSWKGSDTYSGEWEGSYAGEDGDLIDAEYEGTWIDDDRLEGHHPRRHHPRRRPGHNPHHSGPRLGYSEAQREEWLAQCRSLRGDDRQYIVYEEEDDADGGLLGGLLGAIVGGVAGNRIADGDRLAGTLIGAGIGGIAGAVIGSAIDNSDDDYEDIVYVDDEDSFGYCEAYLLNYERGYGAGYGQPGQIAYAPVMMVPVSGQIPAQMLPRHPHGIGHRPMIRREILIERTETAPEPRHPVRQPVAQEQAAASGKIQPIR